MPPARPLLNLFAVEQAASPRTVRTPMNDMVGSLEQFAPQTFRFYRHVLDELRSARVPFLVGGAYALGYYTGITRHTKDFDLFVRIVDSLRTLDILAAAGYRTELTFSHWLGKAFHKDDFVDIIYGSGNGLCAVDDAWFEHAVEGEVFGTSVSLVPAEEIVWQKAYIMERERFDGADINHLLRARGSQMDWERLLARFGVNWRVLLGHLIVYGFVYPDEQGAIPARVLLALTERLHKEPGSSPVVHLCRGPLLSRTQYLPDIEQWGYVDARVAPRGPMTAEQVTRWTDAGR
jgi:Nucleotidyl transferase of unknown function (DUF2204)